MDQRIREENVNESRKSDASAYITSENGGWCDKMKA